MVGIVDALQDLVYKDGNVQWGNILPVVGGIAAARSGDTGFFGESQQPVGYQGGIPGYAAERTPLQVPEGFTENRRPGANGMRYFSDTQYTPTANATPGISTQRIDPRQLQAMGYLYGLDNLGSTNTGTTANTGGLPISGPKVPIVNSPINSPIDPTTGLPWGQTANTGTTNPFSSIAPDGTYTQDELVRGLGILDSGQGTLADAATWWGATEPEMTSEIARQRETVAEAERAALSAEVLGGYNVDGTYGQDEIEGIMRGLNNGVLTPQEVASTFGFTVDEVLEEMARQNQATGYAEGGSVGMYLGGPTDGMADKLPTTIDGNEPAALSHGEFVIPADVVSHLGNGNSEAGAQNLYRMMEKIRSARTGNPKQGKQINPDKYLPV